MNMRTDTFVPIETREVSISGRSPVLLMHREREHGPGSVTRAHTWISDVLADTGLLGATHASRVDEGSIQVVRWPRLPLVIGDLTDHAGSTRRVAAKTYRDDRGAATLALLRRLGAAGLGRGEFRVTAPLGWSSRCRVLVTECAPGEAWSEFLVEGGRRLELASAAVGGWLRALHGMADAVQLPTRTEFRAEPDMLREAAGVGLRYPWHSRRIQEIARAAVEISASSAPREPRLVPSHGDLHPHNIHLDFTEGRVLATALDLDTAGLRRPSYDVGYAVAQLLIMAFMKCGGRFLPGAIGAEVFLSAVEGSSGPGGADDGAVGAQVCRALVQSLHYELVTLDNGRDDLLPAWCGVAEEALSGGVGTMLARLVRGWRP